MQAGIDYALYVPVGVFVQCMYRPFQVHETELRPIDDDPYTIMLRYLHVLSQTIPCARSAYALCQRLRAVHQLSEEQPTDDNRLRRLAISNSVKTAMELTELVLWPVDDIGPPMLSLSMLS